MSPKMLLLFPALAMLAAIVWHSVVFRGARFTKFYFWIGLFYAWLREAVTHANVDGNGLPLYQHSFKSFKLVGSPIQAIVGWLLVGYLGLCIGELVASRVKVWRGKVFPIILVSGLVASAMAFGIESVALALKWWFWRNDAFSGDFEEYLHGVPFIALQGWPNTMLPFLTSLLLAESTNLTKRVWWAYLVWALPLLLAPGWMFAYEATRAGFYAALVLLAVAYPLRYEPRGAPAETDRAGAG